MGNEFAFDETEWLREEAMINGEDWMTARASILIDELERRIGMLARRRPATRRTRKLIRQIEDQILELRQQFPNA